MSNRFFYWKLAYQNLRTNRQHYIPYMLSAIGTIMMYYVLSAQANGNVIGGAYAFGAGTAKVLLEMGTWVVSIFAVLFLFYTFSILIKRRKKEFALYNILGLGKKHIARVLLYETVYVTLISLVLGLLLGILFSKVMTLLLFKILNATPSMGFEVPLRSLVMTAGIFGAIFLLTYLSALREIHRVSPIELLRGGRAGEAEPKANWVIALIGVVTLCAGYYIAVTIEEPFAALMLFFVAVILVIIGTYALFTAGSVAGLKLLRKNKRFYYQTKHFVPVSGMIYRMKQNAAGLASICILSTMVLVMVSTSGSLYMGLDGVVRNNYPRDMRVMAREGDAHAFDGMADAVDGVLARENLAPQSALAYRSAQIPIDEKNGEWTAMPDFEGVGGKMLVLIPYDDVAEHIEGVWRPKRDELLFLTGGDTDVPADAVNLFGERMTTSSRPGNDAFASGRRTDDNLNRYYALVTDEAALDRFVALRRTQIQDDESPEYHFLYLFDLDAPIEALGTLEGSVYSALKTDGWAGYLSVNSAERFRQDGLELFGGLFFLGMLLGLLFTMATVSIIYYKQLSEGYDDRARFEIMHSVGMSRKETRTAIRSQVLIVFFAPLVMAGAHVAFAFPMITRMLSVLTMSDVRTFAVVNVICFAVFAALYALIYALTARVYYKIVAPAS